MAARIDGTDTARRQALKLMAIAPLAGRVEKGKAWIFRSIRRAAWNAPVGTTSVPPTIAQGYNDHSLA